MLCYFSITVREVYMSVFMNGLQTVAHVKLNPSANRIALRSHCEWEKDL